MVAPKDSLKAPSTVEGPTYNRASDIDVITYTNNATNSKPSEMKRFTMGARI
jgi:hypothetical protein